MRTATALAAIWSLGFCADVSAQSPAYFEATGTYQTYSVSGNGGIGVRDCAGVAFCYDANGPIPPWFGGSGRPINITRNGLAITGGFSESSATLTFEGNYIAAGVTIQDPYNGYTESRLQNGQIDVYVLGPPGT